ncbi:putative LRR containing protein [Trachipleistophora hominis]|uniref:Putative LRR containing protein n=1 Tax=Trachipleistophora hominis TaxID=72359 RepID=L7JV50_TRAHO|nr:putative LRR containing protein [Trachipleistophora hominis]
MDFLINDTTYVVNCELTIRGVSISTSLKLSFNIKKIYFEHVCVAENSIVQIDSGFESITMVTCFGKYSIPNITYNDNSFVNLLGNQCSQI